MYGLVNKALADMLREEHGGASWNLIRAEAGVDTEVFVTLDAYPDDVTYRLVASASAITNRPVDDVLRDFGRHWVVGTAHRHYGHLMRAGGRTLRDFLLALPNFHSRVLLIMPGMIPPEFECTDVTDDGMTLHYRSTRAGLAPFVDGALEALAEIFHAKLTVVRAPDRAESAGHTVFELRWTPCGPP
jgi:hypothetical protein